jgi:hypothetical protein
MICPAYLPFFLPSICLAKVADVQDVVMQIIVMILLTFMTIAARSQIL